MILEDPRVIRLSLTFDYLGCVSYRRFDLGH